MRDSTKSFLLCVAPPTVGLVLIAICFLWGNTPNAAKMLLLYGSVGGIFLSWAYAGRWWRIKWKNRQRSITTNAERD